MGATKLKYNPSKMKRLLVVRSFDQGLELPSALFGVTHTKGTDSMFGSTTGPKPPGAFHLMNLLQSFPGRKAIAIVVHGQITSRLDYSNVLYSWFRVL